MALEKKEEIPLCLYLESSISENSWEMSELTDEMHLSSKFIPICGDATPRAGYTRRPYRDVCQCVEYYHDVQFLMSNLERWKEAAIVV